MSHFLLNYPYSPSILFFIGSLFLIACAIFLFFKNRKNMRRVKNIGKKGEMAVQEKLDWYGCMDRLDNVVVGDIKNPKSMAEIDHIVRCEDKFLVVEGKSWSGEIRGSAEDEFWTLTSWQGQVWKRRNPLWQADRQRRILSHVTEGIPVEAVVIILGRNSFPDGIPEGVLNYDSVPQIRRIARKSKGIETNPEDIDRVWSKIVEEQYSDFGREREKVYMKYLSKKRQLFPVWSRTLVLGIAFSIIAILSAVFFRYYGG